MGSSNHPRCIYANKQLHILGGDSNMKHLTFGQDNEKFTTICKLDEFRDRERRGFSRHGMVYSQSKDCIFMFACNLNQDGIFQFSFQTQKWIKLDVKLPKKLTSFGSVITNDEKYIIIVGGIESKDILVFDTDNYSLKTSKIKTVNKTWCYAGLVGDHERNEILTHGYIRSNYNGEYFMIDLVKIIASYNFVEDLYCLEFRSQKHWKIKLCEVLNEFE